MCVYVLNSLPFPGTCPCNVCKGKGCHLVKGSYPRTKISRIDSGRWKKIRSGEGLR